MNRVREYVQFAVRFVGLGYIVLWPLTAHDNDIAGLEGSVVCGGGQPLGLADLICHPPYALQLSPGLHLIGLMSAAFVVLRFLLCQLRRSRRAPGAGDTTASALASRIPAVLPRPAQPPRREPLRPLRPVKPRKNFGLRGAPQ